MSLRGADWKQLGIIARHMISVCDPPENPPEGIDPDAWRACRRARAVFRCVGRWCNFGARLSRTHPLIDTHFWADRPLRWWLYEDDYARIYGADEPEWPKMAGLLLAAHALDPRAHPCLSELQMACFLAWDLDEVLKWALAIARRLDAPDLPIAIVREWKILRQFASDEEGRCRPDRLVTSGAGERRFAFSERGFASRP